MASSLVGQIIAILFLIMMNLAQTQKLDLFFNEGNALGIILLTVAVVPFLSAFNLWFSTHLLQWLAQIFGGVGKYSELVYLRAAYLSPILIITGSLVTIPIIRFLYFIVIFYLLILDVVALKAVNQFGWSKAIVVIILLGIILSVFVCILVLFSSALIAAFVPK